MNTESQRGRKRTANHSYCSRVHDGEIVSCQTYGTIKLFRNVVLCPRKSRSSRTILFARRLRNSRVSPSTFIISLYFSLNHIIFFIAHIVVSFLSIILLCLRSVLAFLSRSLLVSASCKIKETNGRLVELHKRVNRRGSVIFRVVKTPHSKLTIRGYEIIVLYDGIIILELF